MSDHGCNLSVSGLDFINSLMNETLAGSMYRFIACIPNFELKDLDRKIFKSHFGLYPCDDIIDTIIKLHDNHLDCLSYDFSIVTWLHHNQYYYLKRRGHDPVRKLPDTNDVDDSYHALFMGYIETFSTHFRADYITQALCWEFGMPGVIEKSQTQCAHFKHVIQRMSVYNPQTRRLFHQIEDSVKPDGLDEDRRV